MNTGTRDIAVKKVKITKDRSEYSNTGKSIEILISYLDKVTAVFDKYISKDEKSCCEGDRSAVFFKRVYGVIPPIPAEDALSVREEQRPKSFFIRKLKLDLDKPCKSIKKKGHSRVAPISVVRPIMPIKNVQLIKSSCDGKNIIFSASDISEYHTNSVCFHITGNTISWTDIFTVDPNNLESQQYLNKRSILHTREWNSNDCVLDRKSCQLNAKDVFSINYDDFSMDKLFSVHYEYNA